MNFEDTTAWFASSGLPTSTTANLGNRATNHTFLYETTTASAQPQRYDQQQSQPQQADRQSGSHEFQIDGSSQPTSASSSSLAQAFASTSSMPLQTQRQSCSSPPFPILFPYPPASSVQFDTLPRPPSPSLLLPQPASLSESRQSSQVPPAAQTDQGGTTNMNMHPQQHQHHHHHMPMPAVSLQAGDVSMQIQLPMLAQPQPQHHSHAQMSMPMSAPAPPGSHYTHAPVQMQQQHNNHHHFMQSSMGPPPPQTMAPMSATLDASAGPSMMPASASDPAFFLGSAPYGFEELSISPPADVPQQQHDTFYELDQEGMPVVNNTANIGANGVEHGASTTATAPAATASGPGVSPGSGGGGGQKFQRRQNHSCDQCRAAKRACGLRVGKDRPIKVPCDACALRGTVCTTKWLEQKLRGGGAHAVIVSAAEDAAAGGTISETDRRPSSSEGKAVATAAKPKRKRQSSPGPGTSTRERTESWALMLSSARSSPPTTKPVKDLIDGQLSKDVLSRSFCVFLSAWEVPMSEWLGQGCSPFEGGLECIRRTMNDDFKAWSHRLGLSGPASTSFVHHFARDLPADSFKPEHLHATLFLDSALSWMRRRSGDKEIGWRQREPRTAARVEQALLWAMVAHSSQFGDVLEEASPLSPSTRSLRQQVARTSWRKARDAIYALASVDSFALSTAMIIFGLTVRPTGVEGAPHDVTDPDDDTAFCLREGCARAQRLAEKLNASLSTIGNDAITSAAASAAGSADARSFLVGLTNASKWLGIMVTAVAPLADPGADSMGGLRTNEILVLPSETGHFSDSFTRAPNLYHMPAQPPPSATTSWRSAAAQTSPSSSVWDRITERSSSAQSLQSTLLPILQSRKESKELFQYFLRSGSSYKVLMFRATAEVEEVCRSWLNLQPTAQGEKPVSVSAAIDLAVHCIDTWDRCFGDIETAAIAAIPQLSASHRSMLTYLSGHANHAILTLLDLIDGIDDYLASQAHDHHHRHQQHAATLGDLPVRLAAGREVRRARRLHSARLILKGATHRNSLVLRKGHKQGNKSDGGKSGSRSPNNGSAAPTTSAAASINGKTETAAEVAAATGAALGPTPEPKASSSAADTGISTTPSDLSTQISSPYRTHLSLSTASSYTPSLDGLVYSRQLGTWCHPYPALAVRVQAHATSAFYGELKNCCGLETSLGSAASAELGVDRQRRQIEEDLIESMGNLQEIRDSMVFDVDYLLTQFDLPTASKVSGAGLQQQQQQQGQEQQPIHFDLTPPGPVAAAL